MTPHVRPLALACLFALVLPMPALAAIPADPSSHSTADSTASRTEAWWVFFADRGLHTLDAAAAERIAESVAPGVWARRARGSAPAPDMRDLPLWEPYVREIARGGEIRRRSRWLNAVSVDLDPAALERVGRLPFVSALRPVASGRAQGLGPEFSPSGAQLERTTAEAGSLPSGLPPAGDLYGASYWQLQEIEVPALHGLGYTGNRIRMMMLDTGFRKDHDAFARADIFGEWDFVSEDGETQNEPEDPPDQHRHGTGCWATAGGYDPGRMVGPAFGASFFLAKTEDISSETRVEEDNYVAALEWADSLGVAVTSASLAYLCFDDGFCYDPPMRDGNTAVITRAVDIAASRGILCVNGIGNRGDADLSLTTPGDADSIIAVGAVDSLNVLADFSSRGPTDDGRIKPEMVARGVATLWARAEDPHGYGYASGTSLSTPLVGGACALLLEAHPEWGPMQVREALMLTADRASHPDNFYGWGRIRCAAALAYEPVIYPRPFSLLAPTDGTVTSDLSPRLTWRRSLDPQGGVLKYAVHLEESGTRTEWWIPAGTDSAVTIPFSLRPQTGYAWEVAAEDPANNRRLSRERWTFTTPGAAFVPDANGPRSEGPLAPDWLLLSAGPNPFRDEVHFRVLSGEGGISGLDAYWAVYDPSGRRLAGGQMRSNAGRTTAGHAPETGSTGSAWDGRASDGRPVVPGVYYLEVRAGERFARRALVKIQ